MPIVQRILLIFFFKDQVLFMLLFSLLFLVYIANIKKVLFNIFMVLKRKIETIERERERDREAG